MAGREPLALTETWDRSASSLAPAVEAELVRSILTADLVPLPVGDGRHVSACRAKLLLAIAATHRRPLTLDFIADLMGGSSDGARVAVTALRRAGLLTVGRPVGAGPGRSDGRRYTVNAAAVRALGSLRPPAEHGAGLRDRDAEAARMHASGMTLRAIAAVQRRSAHAVLDGVRRHKERMGVAIDLRRRV